MDETYPHEYGTIARAIAAAAYAAAKAMDHSEQGGITGFQASFVMWDFIRAWRSIKGPARLLEYRDMLYPQNSERFQSITKDMWAWLQEEAFRNLNDHEKEGGNVHPAVLAHWKSIAAGVIPFGYRLEVR